MFCNIWGRKKNSIIVSHECRRENQRKMCTNTTHYGPDLCVRRTNIKGSKLVNKLIENGEDTCAANLYIIVSFTFGVKYLAAFVISLDSL